MQVLLISGSTRVGSSNTLVLQSLHELDHPGVTTEHYRDLRELPAFVPDGQPEPPAVTDLLERIRAADAVVFSTPEYAGGLPGALKNLLDWAVGGGVLYRKPVAWLDVANPARGEGARSQLEIVLGYVAARVIPAACLHVTLDRTDAGVTLGGGGAAELAAVLAALAAAIEEADANTVAEPAPGWPAHLRPGALRWVRSSRRYEDAVGFYREVVGLPVVGGFAGSFGDDGTIFGLPDTGTQLEIVRGDPDAPDSDEFDQLVFYLDDVEAMSAATAPLREHGLSPELEPHPYWRANGATLYRDPDGRGLVFAPWVYGRDPDPIDRQPPGTE